MGDVRGLESNAFDALCFVISAYLRLIAHRVFVSSSVSVSFTHDCFYENARHRRMTLKGVMTVLANRVLCWDFENDRERF
jgi:hypothetical protein